MNAKYEKKNTEKPYRQVFCQIDAKPGASAVLGDVIIRTYGSVSLQEFIEQVVNLHVLPSRSFC